MTRQEERAADGDRAAGGGRLALWAALMQALVGLSWIAYVAYLPRLLEMVGLPARAAIWVLLIDQVLFTVFDWLAGVHADRVARLRGRIGGWLAAVSVGSALLLLLLPWAAATGSAVLFFAISLSWSVSSSVMRAPVLSMLGRLGRQRERTRVIAFALSGIGLAAAFAPFLSGLFKGFSPYWPLAITALTMVAASLLAAFVEPIAGKPADDRAGGEARDGGAAGLRGTRGTRELASTALLLLLGASAMQLLCNEISGPTYRRLGAVELMFWMPIFWVSFFAAQGPCKRLLERKSDFAPGAAALLLAAASVFAAQRLGQLGVFAFSQVLAGAAWALLLAGAMLWSTRIAGAGNAGAATGIMFSMLALANVMRLSLALLGVDVTGTLSWWPVAAWLAVALALFAWRSWPARLAAAPG